MNKPEFTYEKDTTIDASALDIEWLQQPQLMMKYTQHEAKCQQRYESAKTNYDIIKAELYKDISSNPEEYDLAKTTEIAIQQAMRQTAKYKDAKDTLHQAQYNWNMAQAAVKSMYAKKDALENLVRLYGQQYFAGPSMPRNIDKEWEKKEKQKQSNKNINITRKRTK